MAPTPGMTTTVKMTLSTVTTGMSTGGMAAATVGKMTIVGTMTIIIATDADITAAESVIAIDRATETGARDVRDRETDETVRVNAITEEAAAIAMTETTADREDLVHDAADGVEVQVAAKRRISFLYTRENGNCTIGICLLQAWKAWRQNKLNKQVCS